MNLRIPNLVRAAAALAPLLLVGCVAVPDGGSVVYDSPGYRVESYPLHSTYIEFSSGYPVRRLPPPHVSPRVIYAPGPNYVTRPPVVVVQPRLPVVIAPAHPQRPPPHLIGRGGPPPHAVGRDGDRSAQFPPRLHDGRAPDRRVEDRRVEDRSGEVRGGRDGRAGGEVRGGRDGRAAVGAGERQRGG